MRCNLLVTIVHKSYIWTDIQGTVTISAKFFKKYFSTMTSTNKEHIQLEYLIFSSIDLAFYIEFLFKLIGNHFGNSQTAGRTR